MFGIMATALVVLGATTVTGYVRASRYKMNLNYNYQRAMRDLTDSVDNIETTLNKSIYANTATQQNGFAAKLMRETSMAKASLSVLPLQTDTISNVGKYITQVGDFSMALSNKVSAGEEISADEYKSIQNLQKYAGKLKESLKDANMDADVEQINPTFNTAAEDFTNYPSLIYDGPFSDHVGQRKPKLLEGKKKVLQGNAQNVAAEFLGVQASQLAHTQDTEGGLPTYNFTAGSIRISVTKAGGIVTTFTDSRGIGEQKLEVKEAMKVAQDFLKAKGLKNMDESYYMIHDGMCSINFAYRQGNVRLYPDLIKVSVALDNGSIVGYNATGYVMNHKDRGELKPDITPEKAQAAVSKRLKVESAELAVIPTPGMNQVLCYEFLCTGENKERVLVYINAKTGLEQDILIMMQSDQGIMAQ